MYKEAEQHQLHDAMQKVGQHKQHQDGIRRITKVKQHVTNGYADEEKETQFYLEPFDPSVSTQQGTQAATA